MKFKRIILFCICTAMALMILLGMLCNVVQISNNDEVGDYENGYTLLSFSSDFILSSQYDWGAVICGIVNLIILLSGIIALGAIIYSLLNKKELNHKLVIILACVTSILYMIEGVVFTSICKDTYSSYLSDYIHTVSFVPMILQFVLTLSYILYNKYCIESSETTYKNNAEKSESANINYTSDKLSLLKQYKELLNSGVITEEEFEEQKKKLL